MLERSGSEEEEGIRSRAPGRKSEGGVELAHAVLTVGGPSPNRVFNGNLTKPTIQPSTNEPNRLDAPLVCVAWPEL